MSDVDSFNRALALYNKTKGVEAAAKPDGCSASPPMFQNNDSECPHSSLIVDREVTVCTDCGVEIDRAISTAKEWRHHSATDTKRGSDPSRVHIRKNEERNIFKDVENLNLSDNIVSQANKLYLAVTKGQIFRGDNRRSLVFACIFNAFKMSETPLSHESLYDMFKINKGIGLKGIKFVSMHAPRDSAIRTTYITPPVLVDEIMDRFDATQAQKDEVKALYKRIRNRSSALNRSRPQSVAAGLTYYWIRLNEKPITLKNFVRKVSLRELTVNKIAKEIARVLRTPGVI